MSPSCLLVSTLTLWILLTAMPVFDSVLPQITLPWDWTDQQQITFPSAEILTTFVGLSFYLSAYCLLVQRSGRKLSPKKNILFNICGYLIMYGFGMHATCVMTEEKAKLPGNAMSPSLAAHVNFVHEIVAHNTFMGWFWVLQMFIVFEEKASFLYKLQKKTDKVTTSSDKGASNTRLLSNGCSPQSVAFEWLFPVILGAYFPIFGTQTHTAITITAFYILVLLYSAVTWKQLVEEDGKGSSICACMGSDLMMWGTVLKSSCVGLPIMAVWFTVRDISQ